MYMMTKWEWIASGIHELGYPNLAEMALVIDKHIAELYGERKVTEEWCNAYDEIYNLNKDPASIRYIINNSDFCYSCNNSDIQKLDCIDCIYGQKYGVCEDMDSEFGIFRRIFVGIFAV